MRSLQVLAHVLAARLIICANQSEMSRESDVIGGGVDDQLVLIQTRAERHAPRHEMETVGHKFPTDKATAWGSPHGGSGPVAILGIGFQKCATTFSNSVLHKHPEVVPGINGIKKEKHYFDSGVEWNGNCKSHVWQASGQPYKRYLDECFAGVTPGVGNQFRATVDISPTYAVFDEVPSRILAMKGEVTPRFLVWLRDPRERLLSMCNMERRAPVGRRNTPGKVPYKATSEELGKLLHLYIQSRKQELKKAGFAAYANLNRAGFEGDIRGHIARGEYHHWVSQWTKHFPTESMLVVNFKHVDDEQTWQRIYQHSGLSVPADTKKQIKDAANSDDDSKSEVPPVDVSADVKKEISDYYDPHDAKLWKMLGTHWW